MPYILIKKDGKTQRTPFVFTEDEVYNLSRDWDHRYTLLNPVTMRTKVVGGMPSIKRKRAR